MRDAAAADAAADGSRGAEQRRRACGRIFTSGGLSSLGIWCVFAAGRIRGGLAQTETSAWLNRAAALQRYIG